METDTLVPENPRAIRADIARRAGRRSEVVGRLSTLGHHHSNTTRVIASVAREATKPRALIDRREERLGRIERRLDLIDA